MKYDILSRLRSAGSQGADLSPGDPLCAEAADELQRLRAELKNSHNSYALQSANLRAENDRSLEQADFWRAETVKLRAELAALQADAMRYRWLRRAGVDPVVSDLFVNICESEPETPELFDAAIESAIDAMGEPS